MKKKHNDSGDFPGQIWAADKTLELLEDRKYVELTVVNCADRPIQVGSHFHFFEVNKYLDFDRKSAYGMRLAIPAGTAVRFEPGMSLDISLVEIKGEGVCYGLNGLVMGSLEDNKEEAFKKARDKGFKGVENGN